MVTEREENARCSSQRMLLMILCCQKVCDLITPKMIKEAPTAALRLFPELFYVILKPSYFPNAWKYSQIIMIAKPVKNRTQVSNYTPPCIFKLFERIFLSKISNFLHRNKVKNMVMQNKSVELLMRLGSDSSSKVLLENISL